MKAKARSLLLFFFLWLLGFGCRGGEGSREGKSKGPGELNQPPPFSLFIYYAGRIHRSDPRFAALNAVDVAAADSRVPRLRNPHTCAQ
jgi:hypothetical protein